MRTSQSDNGTEVVWEMLHKTAESNNSDVLADYVINVNPQVDASILDFQGDSIFNQMLDDRASNDDLIRQMCNACNDTSWMLECGDVVYIKSDPRPYKVFRIGFGPQFGGKVRVAQIKEDAIQWEKGSWRSTADTFMLDAGDHCWP